MLNGIFTNIGIIFLKLLARLPFGILYALSGFMYFVVYQVLRYRRTVVVKNLVNAFPEKKPEEIKNIERKFYRHFCDLTLETIKLNRMSREELERRMKTENSEIIEKFTKAGRNVTVLSMHFNNWEWATFLSSVFSATTLAVYKPLHNNHFDLFMNQNRSRFGAELVENNRILRRIIRAEKEHKPVIIWLAGDQTPPWYHNSWFKFMNQEAIFYQGPAFIARRFNTPVIFQTTEKTSRGNYCTRFELLIENPALMAENEIIKTYIRKMEEVIQKNPEYYLWSHKRWKYKRDAGVPLNE